jgi:hypothetical protein
MQQTNLQLGFPANVTHVIRWGALQQGGGGRGAGVSLRVLVVFIRDRDASVQGVGHGVQVVWVGGWWGGGGG